MTIEQIAWNTAKDFFTLEPRYRNHTRLAIEIAKAIDEALKDMDICQSAGK